MEPRQQRRLMVDGLELVNFWGAPAQFLSCASVWRRMVLQYFLISAAGAAWVRGWVHADNTSNTATVSTGNCNTCPQHSAHCSSVTAWNIRTLHWHKTVTHLSLAGAATSIILVATKVLLRQSRVCRDNHVFCRDKSMLAATNTCESTLFIFATRMNKTGTLSYSVIEPTHQRFPQSVQFQHNRFTNTRWAQSFRPFLKYEWQAMKWQAVK